MNKTKKELRQYLLPYKRLVETSIYREKSSQIATRAISLISDLSVKNIHLYLPIERNREPDTVLLLSAFNSDGYTFFVSKTDFEQESMHHFIYNESLKFRKNKLGIPEPDSDATVSLDKVEVIVMPLLAMDRQGNRLGYGKGYYDRLLADMPTVIKIGLSLAPPFDHFPFGEPHDVKMDYGITPDETIKFP